MQAGWVAQQADAMGVVAAPVCWLVGALSDTSVRQLLAATANVDTSLQQAVWQGRPAKRQRA